MQNIGVKRIQPPRACKKMFFKPPLTVTKKTNKNGNAHDNRNIPMSKFGIRYHKDKNVSTFTSKNYLKGSWINF